MKTVYWVKGHGMPVIFIHGAFVDSSMWDRQVSYFSKNYKVITYDLRGHGKTQGKAGEYSFDAYVQDLDSLIDKTCAGQKPVICGLSLGGMIAQAYAARYSDKISGLIVADSAVTLTLTWWDRIMKLLFPEWVMVLSLRMTGVKSFSRLSFFLGKITRGRKWLGKEHTYKYINKQMLMQEKEAWINTYRVIYAFRKQKLFNISVPTLVIIGEYEPASLYKHAEVLKREIKDCQVQVIYDSGHIPCLDQPDHFNKVVEIFCEKIHK
ncbi:alpha/beta hydrolase [Cytophagaceae bacterium ABcell3]|nr:alpha/beta hydrolase [Cytophagaceae bacterium ABcell3]